MKTYEVTVLPEEGGDAVTKYLVKSSSPEDAQQLAFALDGGWGEETNAEEMLPLAQMYCSAKEIDPREGYHFCAKDNCRTQILDGAPDVCPSHQREL